MEKIVMLFLIFLKIGMFSFGGGFAMLPFIEQEFIDKFQFITEKEFIDLLAISQSTPGPIAINSATFVGFKTAGVFGALAATLGAVSFSLFGLVLISKYLMRKSNEERFERLLKTLKPITTGFILSAVYTSAMKVDFGLYEIIAFGITFALLFTKKVSPIFLIFFFGIFGILANYLNFITI